MFLFLGVYVLYKLNHYAPDKLHIRKDNVQINEQSYVLDSVHYYFSSAVVLAMRDDNGRQLHYQITQWHIPVEKWRKLVAYTRLRAMHTA